MPTQAFSRQNRLTERYQFIRLFDNASHYRASSFQAYWKKNNQQAARLGITIKGRLSSVWRMRIKRFIREWFRVMKNNTDAVDINIVIKVPKEIEWDFFDTLKKQLSGWKPLESIQEEVRYYENR